MTRCVSGRDQVEPQTPCGDGYACEEGEFCAEYWDGPNSGQCAKCGFFVCN